VQAVTLVSDMLARATLRIGDAIMAGKPIAVGRMADRS